MPRFSVFISDPEVVKPYVGVARIEVEGEDEMDARAKAADTYDRVAVGSFTQEDVRFAAQIADPDDHDQSGLRVAPRGRRLGITIV
jgi:hypothetical protein